MKELNTADLFRCFKIERVLYDLILHRNSYSRIKGEYSVNDRLAMFLNRPDSFNLKYNIASYSGLN